MVDEQAYKAALERIPEPKEKYDPWSGGASDGSRPKNRNDHHNPGQDRNCDKLASRRGGASDLAHI